MAVLTQSSTIGAGARAITLNTLTSSDTFTYQPGTGQALVIHNATAGALTPTLGCGAATIAVPGIPSVVVTTFAIGSIAIGASRNIALDTIAPYLTNGSSAPTITLAAGTGLLCWLMQDV